MRIAYIVPRCLPTNGHGRYVLELVKALAPGHDLHIFSSAFPSSVRLPAVQHRVRLPDRPAIARLGAWWAASRLLVGTTRFDVVHTHGADAPVGTVVTAPCCNTAIRAALREADGGNGGAYASSRPPWFVRLNGRIAEAADAYCMSRPHVRRIIVPSGHVRRELQTLYNLPAGKMTLVPHGVDTDHFSPQAMSARRAAARAAFGFHDRDLVAVFVGGAYRLKGLPSLLEAMRQLPNTRLRLPTVRRSDRRRGVNAHLKGIGRHALQQECEVGALVTPKPVGYPPGLQGDISLEVQKRRQQSGRRGIVNGNTLQIPARRVDQIGRGLKRLTRDACELLAVGGAFAESFADLMGQRAAQVGMIEDRGR